VSEAAIAKAEHKARLAARTRFEGKARGPYSYEAYVFYKTCEEPPATLNRVAPCLMDDIAAVPLHQFYLVTRHQPVVDAGRNRHFTPWRLEPATFPDAAALNEALIQRAFPPRCPKPGPDTGGPSCNIWRAALIALALMAGAVLMGAGLWAATTMIEGPAGDRADQSGEISGRSGPGAGPGAPLASPRSSSADEA
jgi:hypothetical protein